MKKICKLLFSFLLSAITTINITCIGENYVCADCMSPAFKITMVDSLGVKISGFTITLIDDKLNVQIVNDTNQNYWEMDSSYSIYGKSGTYTIEIIHNKYNPITLEGMVSTKNRCGDSNPRHLTIVPTEKKLSKRSAAGYTISKDVTEPGCGN
jgi:hypothetical protein